MKEYHGGLLGGHYSGNRLYNVLSDNWYWDGMYTDALEFCRSCPQCAIVTGGGGMSSNRYTLHIPVQRIFQIIGLDIMDLPVTVNMSLFSKTTSPNGLWSLLCQTSRIAELLYNQGVFGVPETILTDRGTNLLSGYLFLLGYHQTQHNSIPS